MQRGSVAKKIFCYFRFLFTIQTSKNLHAFCRYCKREIPNLVRKNFWIVAEHFTCKMIFCILNVLNESQNPINVQQFEPAHRLDSLIYKIFYSKLLVKNRIWNQGFGTITWKLLKSLYYRKAFYFDTKYRKNKKVYEEPKPNEPRTTKIVNETTKDPEPTLSKLIFEF